MFDELPTEGVWNDDVVCFIVAVEYRAESGDGRLVIRRNNHPDMTGTIRMFTAIDPGVRRILVGYKTGETDVIYVRQHSKWTAIDVARARRFLAAEAAMQAPE